MTRKKNTASNRSIGAAIGLFFLAPLIAEFLLGNLPITMLPALIVLAPMYGGGAVLIREAVRHTRRGWPSIIVLGLAYGVLEEAFTTQSLFNPNYLSLGLHLLQPAYIPALGIGGRWTIFVLTLHAAWSIATPIALIEASVPARATTPWLGRFGLVGYSLLFATGIVSTTLMGWRQNHFLASHAQLATAAVVLAILIFLGFRLPRRHAVQGVGAAPNPWAACALTLAAGSAVLLIPQSWGWWAVASILAIELAVVFLVLSWSRRAAWNLRHILALAGGAALAYAWHAFIETPAVGRGSVLPVRIGNAVFALGAVLLIIFAAKRTSHASAVVGQN